MRRPLPLLVIAALSLLLTACPPRNSSTAGAAYETARADAP